MALKEIKTKWQHYYENDAGQKHGEYKHYYKDGQLLGHRHYNNGKLHGEYKRYYENGQLWVHTYDVNGVEVHNFLVDGDSPEIRGQLFKKYGAPLLINDDFTHSEPEISAPKSITKNPFVHGAEVESFCVAGKTLYVQNETATLVDNGSAGWWIMCGEGSEVYMYNLTNVQKIELKSKGQ